MEIAVRALVKSYEVPVRGAGLSAALRALFHREYKTVTAVNGVSFDIAAGERVGFLGPNGAGKTTTLKCLAGLLSCTRGEVTVGGYNPSKRQEEFLKRVTLVAGQKQQLLWDLPPTDTFALNRAIYEVPAAQYRETLDALVALLKLDAVLHKPVRQLSLGERMKCELAAALLHRPKVLFLDEPTIGLDVVMQSAVRSFIKEYNEAHGATVILTSHAMDDVTALCPRVMVINRGEIVYDGSREALVERVRPGRTVKARLSAPAPAALVGALDRRGCLRAHEGATLTLEVARAELGEVLAAVLAEAAVEDLSIEEPPLDEVMAELFAKTEAP